LYALAGIRHIYQYFTPAAFGAEADIDGVVDDLAAELIRKPRSIA
jgi:hypothetical protein